MSLRIVAVCAIVLVIAACSAPGGAVTPPERTYVRVESDPIARGPNCHSPMRLRNVRPNGRNVRVVVRHTWQQEGGFPECQTPPHQSTMTHEVYNANTVPLGCGQVLPTGMRRCGERNSWQIVSQSLAD